MNALPVNPRPAREIIDAAIAAHGPLRVFAAALVALLRPRARPPDPMALPPKLRRDVGLAEMPPPLPSARLDPLLPAARDLGPRF